MKIRLALYLKKLVKNNSNIFWSYISLVQCYIGSTE